MSLVSPLERTSREGGPAPQGRRSRAQRDSYAERPKEAAFVLRIGIRQKVLLVLLTVLFSAMSLSGWLMLRSQREWVRLETVRNNEHVLSYVSASLAYSVVGYDYHTVQLLLEQLTRSEDIVYAKVLSPKGNVMAEVGSFDASLDSQRLLRESILINGEIVGEVFLGVSNQRIVRNLDRQKKSLIQRELTILLLIAVGEFLALSFIILRPIRTISEHISRNVLEDGSIGSHIPIDSQDEIGEVAGRLNLMREKLTAARGSLQTRIEAADKELAATNRQLRRQSIELQEKNERLQSLAATDPLTELFNRRRFEETLEKEVASSIRYGDSFSLIVLDIDRFKLVNDQFGHDVGDSVIREVAIALRNVVRRADSIFRIGGDEFVVLCRNTTDEGALNLAEKIRRALEGHPVATAEGSLDVTASFGIASIPSTAVASDPGILLKSADLALYRSKEEGRNRATHHSTMVSEPLRAGSNPERPT